MKPKNMPSELKIGVELGPCYKEDIRMPVK